MVTDLSIPRVELSAFHDVLHWSPDGSIALNTTNQVTILTPKHTKEEVKQASSLFNTTKFELDTLPTSELFNAEMEDERTGTLFTTLDQTITKLQWSPLLDNVSYLAILTSHHNILILKDGQLWKNLTTKETITSQAQFDLNKVHSITWTLSDDSLYLVEGLASGHIRSIELSEVESGEPIKVSENAIVMLKSSGDVLFAISSKNEIFKISGTTVETLKGPDRFKVYDLFIANDTTVYFSTCGKLTKLEQNKDPLVTDTGVLTQCQVFPIDASNIVLVSQTQSAQFDTNLQQVTNGTVEPVIKKRISRWNSKFNDFNTKKPSLKIFGADINSSGNLLALLYELDQDVKFKYQIASEGLFKISFIPLKNNFTNLRATSLSQFQEFKLSGVQPSNTPQETTPDYSVDLSSFIKDFIIQDGEILSWSSENLITGDKDELIKKKYAGLLLSYIKRKKMKLNHQIDKALYNNLHLVSGQPVPGPVNNVSFNGGAFSEVFDFTNEQDPQLLTSKTDTQWATCSLTFLPILTTNVKIDPATDRRFIDIERDTLNDYGPLTKTILDSTHISIYSGCRCISK